MPGVCRADILATELRSYGGLVSGDMAAQAAGMAARQSAYALAVKALAKEDRQARRPVKDAPDPLQGVAALACPVISQKTQRTFMDGLAAMEATVAIKSPDNTPAAFEAAMQRPDLVEQYAQAALYQNRILAEFDALAAALLDKTPRKEGGMKERHRLVYLAGQMRATQIFQSVLPEYGRGLSAPRNLRAKLAEANRASAGNPLILCALAEFAVQDNHYDKALELASAALHAMPDFARAHHVKGTALLGMNLIKQAEESYGTAIRHFPANPMYYAHRANLRYMLRDTEGMCADAQTARSMGGSAMLAWDNTDEMCASQTAQSGPEPR